MFLGMIKMVKYTKQFVYNIYVHAEHLSYLTMENTEIELYVIALLPSKFDHRSRDDSHFVTGTYFARIYANFRSKIKIVIVATRLCIC